MNDMDSMAGVTHSGVEAPPAPPAPPAETIVDELRASRGVASETFINQPAEAAASDDVPAMPGPDVPIHRAVCRHRKCEVWVTYRPTATGHGFAVLERGGCEIDATFGLAENGVPACPHGHGALELADEQLPAGDAITQVAGQLAEARRLPYPLPDFNFEGALHDIIRKRHEVKAQELKCDKSGERAKKDREDLKDLQVELGEMIDDYEKREEEKRAEQERRAQGVLGVDDPRLIHCAWEQRNPSDGRCPMCEHAIAERKQAPGSEGHAIEVRDWLEARKQTAALEQCVRELETIPIFEITVDHLRTLPLDHLADIVAWASDAAEHPDQRERWMEGGLPAGLGRPHVAPGSFTSETIAADGDEPESSIEFQCCTECGARIKVCPGGVDAYPAGALVGTDCEPPERARAPRRHKSSRKKSE